MKYVDSHAHVFEPGLPLAKKVRYVPEYTASIEQFIANLDAHQMKTGVLIQPSFLGTNNDYMINAIDQYPDRLYGVVVIEPTISRDILDEYNRHNIIGIRLNLYGQAIPDLKFVEWQTCLGHIRDLNWHVEVHYDASDMIEVIDTLLESGVKVVIDHFAKPTTDNPLKDKGVTHILSLAKTNRLWIKVSAAYRLGGVEKGCVVGKAIIQTLIDSFGPNHLLWGSDWPHTNFESNVNYDVACKLLNDIVEDESIKKVILEDSFYELLK